jgi:hypothetical protein
VVERKGFCRFRRVDNVRDVEEDLAAGGVVPGADVRALLAQEIAVLRDVVDEILERDRTAATFFACDLNCGAKSVRTASQVIDCISRGSTPRSAAARR